MSSILVNDIFEELKEENKRLLNELLFSEKCLKVLIKLKIAFNSHSNKFKQCLKSNEWKRLEKLNEEINKTLFKIDVNSDENIVNEENVSIKRGPNSVIDNDFVYGSAVRVIEKKLSNEEEYEEPIYEDYEDVLNNTNEELEQNSSDNEFDSDQNSGEEFISKKANKSNPIKKSLNSNRQKTNIRDNNKTNDERKTRSIKKHNEPVKCDQHLGIVHMSEQNIKCDICGKCFKNSVTLRKHKDLKHLKEKNLSCHHTGCQFRTSKRFNLQQHKLSHSTERPFTCDVNGCNKRFTTNFNLKSHSVSHLTECNINCIFEGCLKKFKSQNLMKNHLKHQHTDKEMLRCDWPGCEYQTKFKSNLSTHRYVHKTERDFVCEWPECGKGFKDKTHLNAHKSVHIKNKGYV